MTNPNRCATCDHKRWPDGGHCYMFRDEPADVCMHHTGRRLLKEARMISDDERRARFAHALASEANSPAVCLWMSFCDTTKPKGQQFLGVVITRAKGLAHAIEKTHLLGINPGGEVMSYETDESDIDPTHFDKLLTKDELVAAGYIDA